MPMPRLARLDAPGILHHVIGRGIERKKIFFNDTDRSDFIDRLTDLAEEGAMDVYAWVLMPNHYHILCKTRHRPLPSSMRKILTGYFPERALLRQPQTSCRWGTWFNIMDCGQRTRLFWCWCRPIFRCNQLLCNTVCRIRYKAWCWWSYQEVMNVLHEPFTLFLFRLSAVCQTWPGI